MAKKFEKVDKPKDGADVNSCSAASSKGNIVRGKSKNKRYGKADSTNSNRNKVNRNVKGSKDDMTKQTGNDPSFYGNNASLVENMTNIYFNHPTGFPIPGAEAGNATMQRDPAPMAGVLSVPLLPTYGDTQSFDSPLGMAGKMIYMAMASKTGRKSEYQMSDVLQYLMAMDNVYMHIAEAQRVYGLYKMISPYNRYLPKAIIKALGWNYESILGKPADFQFKINTVVEMVNQLVMPQFNDLFKVHMSLLNAVYYDHESLSAKPQHIVFTLGSGGYRYFDTMGLLAYGNAARAYNQNNNNSISGLDAHKVFVNTSTGELIGEIEGNLWSPASWFAYMLDCINDINGSEIMTKISTDLMLRFNTSGFVQLNPIPENYVTPFVYDQNVMMMLQNATYAGTNVVQPGMVSEQILKEYKSDSITGYGVYCNYLSHDGVDIQAIKSRVGFKVDSIVRYRITENRKSLYFCGLVSSTAPGVNGRHNGISMLGNIAQRDHVFNVDFDYTPNGLNLLEATRLMCNLGSFNHISDSEIPNGWIPTAGEGYIRRPWYLDLVDYGFWVMLKPQLFYYHGNGDLQMTDWAYGNLSFQFFKGPRPYRLMISPAGQVNKIDCDIITEGLNNSTPPLCQTAISETIEYQIVSTIERELLKKLNYIAVSSVLRVPVNSIPDLRN